jgi:hypothetical protein
MPVIPGKKDSEFNANLGCLGRPCLKNKQTNKKAKNNSPPPTYKEKSPNRIAET